MFTSSVNNKIFIMSINVKYMINRVLAWEEFTQLLFFFLGKIALHHNTYSLPSPIGIVKSHTDTSDGICTPCSNCRCKANVVIVKTCLGDKNANKCDTVMPICVENCKAINHVFSLNSSSMNADNSQQFMR